MQSHIANMRSNVGSSVLLKRKRSSGNPLWMGGWWWNCCTLAWRAEVYHKPWIDSSDLPKGRLIIHTIRFFYFNFHYLSILSRNSSRLKCLKENTKTIITIISTTLRPWIHCRSLFEFATVLCIKDWPQIRVQAGKARSHTCTFHVTRSALKRIGGHRAHALYNGKSKNCYERTKTWVVCVHLCLAVRMSVLLSMFLCLCVSLESKRWWHLHSFMH